MFVWTKDTQDQWDAMPNFPRAESSHVWGVPIPRLLSVQRALRVEKPALGAVLAREGKTSIDIVVLRTICKES